MITPKEEKEIEQALSSRSPTDQRRAMRWLAIMKANPSTFMTDAFKKFKNWLGLR